MKEEVRPPAHGACRPGGPGGRGGAGMRDNLLTLELLEPRSLPSVTSVLAGGVLTVTGTPGRDSIRVALEASTGDLVVRSFAQEVGRFASAAVTSIVLDG